LESLEEIHLILAHLRHLPFSDVSASVFLVVASEHWDLAQELAPQTLD
jgi:hypothetical protein